MPGIRRWGFAGVTSSPTTGPINRQPPKTRLTVEAADSGSVAKIKRRYCTGQARRQAFPLDTQLVRAA
jgi:hypothetical protein